jgi:hypothetical protein
MTRIKPGGKSESDRRSATVSAVTARPRSTSTLMSSGTRPRHARSWSELWSLYRMSCVAVHRPWGQAKPSSLLNGRIDLDQMHGWPARKRPTSPRGLDCSLANTSSIGDCPGSAGSWQSFTLSANGNDAPINSFQWQCTAGVSASSRGPRGWFDLRQCPLTQNRIILPAWVQTNGEDYEQSGRRT